MSEHKTESAHVALVCMIRRRWLRRRIHMPFWRDDKVAQMLGIAQYGCRRCGHGSIEERDAAASISTTPACACEGYTIRTDYGTGVEHDVDRSSCPIHGGGSDA